MFLSFFSFAKRVPIAALFVSMAFVASQSFAAEHNKEYAVKTFNGVPMITINGTPVRSRVFFGIKNASSVVANSEWETHEYEFVPQETIDGDGTLHFRFGSGPGIVFIDNVSITEKESGTVVAGPYAFEKETEFSESWESWHETFQNVEIASIAIQKDAGADNSNALVVRINDCPKELRPDFHIYHKARLSFKKGTTYVVKFDLRADATRKLNVSLYRPSSPTFIQIASLGKNVFESQIELAANAGVDFVSFIAPLWPQEDGSYDWTFLDGVCDDALKANPNALLIPRLDVQGTKKWLAAHPEAQAKWEKTGQDYNGQGWLWATPTSPEYRQTVCDALSAAIRHLEEKYGDSIAGYHPAGQNTNEWFTPNTWTEGYHGFSNADRVAFRQWLVAKYKNDEALRKAWNDPNVTLETAEVPSVEERDDSREKPIVKSQKLLDFNAFWQDAMADLLLDIAKTIKRETDGRKLSVLFYGYSYEFSIVAKGPAASAHYALQRLLDSPDVDIICSPFSYYERQLGAGGCCMLNAESVSAAGKLYLYEDDARTYLAYANGVRQFSPTSNVNDSINVLLRNSGECALRNLGTWLMDLGATGWYDSPELWQASASLEKLDRYFLENPTPYVPEVGVFLGEQSMLKISSGNYSGKGIYYFRKDLDLLGAPYAQYELNDLLEERVSAPKLTIILNSEALDEETRTKIQEQATKTNARILWIDGSGTDTHALRREAAKAGVWVYTNLWCNVWANGPFVLLHAPADGDYTFSAPEGKKKIYDYFTDKLLSDDGKFVFPMKLGDTKIFRLE